MAKARTRPQPGDIVEIRTSQGTVRAQYTHHHPTFGAVLRVFRPGWSEPAPLEELARWPVQFITLFPLGAACRRGIARVIGPAAIPAEAAAFPLFRAGTRDPQTGLFGDNWWLWDGEREWPIGRMTPEHRGLPLREIVNDTLLVQRALAGWTPSQEA